MTKRILPGFLIALTLCIALIAGGALLPADHTLFKWCVRQTSNKTAKNNVVKGWSGWLFFQPELDYYLKGAEPGNINRITEFSRALRAHGITLYFVPVPHKLDLYPEKFIPLPVARPVNPSRTATIRQLRENGVAVIDLLPGLEAGGKNQAIFERYDSHWTPKGIQLSSSIIARAIDSSLVSRNIPRTTRFQIHDTHLNFIGDLREKIAADTVHRWYSLPVGQIGDSTGGAYRDFRESRVLILGDSFVDRARWVDSQLGAHLSRELGYTTRTFFSLLSNVEGPCLYERKPALFPKEGIVIWVLASRVLQYEMCGSDSLPIR